MPYSLELTDLALDELNAIKPYHRSRIIDAVDTQLQHEPSVETKNRKILVSFQPDFQHEVPVWELRVGQYRVYYDVNEVAKTVTVRAVREKPPHITTEQTA